MTAVHDWDIAGATDAQLAGAAAAGDRAAFAGIYDRYADRLHDFCVGMVRDRDAAADCVQDVFCTAATTLPGLRELDKLRPWLYSIARNEALRCIRARTRERVSDELPDAASGEPGPDTLAARSELADLIAEAAGGLSDRDRAVLELTYRHGLDGPELAEALGVSHTNARTMVGRLRLTIERSLGALLVARRARNSPDGCPELGAILAGWDGRFTILMRKRIARHIESCPVCEQDRRRLVNPVALLGGVPVFIPAPGWLREHTLSQVQLTSASANMTDTAGPGDRSAHNGSETAPTQSRSTLSAGANQGEAGEHQQSDGFLTRRLILLVALFIGIPVTILGLTIAWQHLQTTPGTPLNPIGVTGTAPAPTNPIPPAAPTTGSTPTNLAPPPPAPPTHSTVPAVPVSPSQPPLPPAQLPLPTPQPPQSPNVTPVSPSPCTSRFCQPQRQEQPRPQLPQQQPAPQPQQQTPEPAPQQSPNVTPVSPTPCPLTVICRP